MASRELPSPETLRQLLRYEPDTGRLFWLPREGERPGWNGRYAGKEAFTAIDSEGYRSGKIFGASFRAHRVIWAMQTGAWPVDEVDHRDRDTQNNRWDNLREATRSQNAMNRAADGVFYAAHRKRWVAEIVAGGKVIRLGGFVSRDDALSARAAAEIEHHGVFGRG